MESSSNANHPDNLHEFLNQAILDQTGARGIVKNCQLIPPDTLDLPEYALIMRWSIIQERRGRKAAVLAIMRTGSRSVDLDLGDDENGFLPNQIPRQLSHMLDEGKPTT